MEWPKVNVPKELFYNSNTGQTEYDYDDYESLISTITSILITKEIYARAAAACVSDITIDHNTNGLRRKVDTFLRNLKSRTVNGGGDDDDATDNAWITSEYRTISREFVELMSYAASVGGGGGGGGPNYGRIYEICQGGLDAVHDLLKYRLPDEDPEDCDVLAAKDAYVLCQSLPQQFDTKVVSGSRPPDIEYKFGLFGEGIEINNESVDINDVNSLYGLDACKYVTELRNNGYIETSACSLANYTFTANPNTFSTELTAQNKTFVVLGCDHPLAPTKSLLRIPGVTVLGIPTSWKGLDDILEYVTYNSPDNTSFLYPILDSTNSSKKSTRKKKRRYWHDGNYIVSHGPHIAQWILDNTNDIIGDDDDGDTTKDDTDADTTNEVRRRRRHNGSHELVIVPMPSPGVSNHESAVRYSAASDLILQRVLRARHSNTISNNNQKLLKISLWMYQNSTTCMVVPPASTTKAKELLEQRPSHEPWIHTLSRNTVLTPTSEEDGANSTNEMGTDATAVDVVENESKMRKDITTTTTGSSSCYNNHEYAIVNGIVAGPGGAHHVLAETIRVWRCLLVSLAPHFQSPYDRDDTDTTTNDIHVFAPCTPLVKGNDIEENEFVATEHNTLLKIFDNAGTASSLLTAIGLATILDPIVNRPMPMMFDDDFGTGESSASLTPTPFALFWNGSAHSGIWNCPYTLDSMTGYTSHALGKIYNYYDYYAAPYIHDILFSADKNNNTIPAAAASSTNNGNDDDDPSKQQQGDDDHHQMPDIVHERLEMLAQNFNV